MSKLAAQIQKACSLLGLRVELGFTLSLNDGVKIHTVARIPELGPPNGMLVISSVETFRGFSQRLVDAGYGASVISEPARDGDLDLDSWRETFIDWGWGGDATLKPKWMTEPPFDELKDGLLNNSSNEVTREAAARSIALVHWEDDRAQQLLVDCIQSGHLSASLKLSCIDALADIWIRRGELDKRAYDELGSDDLRQRLTPWFKELQN